MKTVSLFFLVASLSLSHFAMGSTSDSLRLALTEANTRQDSLTVLCKLISYHQVMGHTDSVRDYLALGKTWLPGVADVAYAYALGVYENTYLLHTQQYPALVRHSDSLLQVSQQIQRPAWACAPLNNLGVAQLYQGHKDSAFQLLSRAWETLDVGEQPYSPLMGSILQESKNSIPYNQAMCVINQDYALTVFYLNRALAIYRESGDVQSEILALAELGKILARLSAYDEAEAAYRKSVQLARGSGLDELEVKALLGLASVLRRVAALDRADSVLDEAAAFTEVLSHGWGRSYQLQRAHLLHAQGQYQASNVYYQQILDDARAGHSKTNEVYGLQGLAQNYLKLGQARLAVRHLEETLAYWKAKGNLAQQKTNLETLIPAYAALGQSAQAQQAALDYLEVNQLVLSEGLEQQIAHTFSGYWSQVQEAELQATKAAEAQQALALAQTQAENQALVSQRNLLVVSVLCLVLAGVLVYIFLLQRRKTRVMNQVHELELKALRAQINPHFLFNALGSIQLLVNQGALREANLSLARFANLVRRILQHSEKQYLPLQEELDMLEQYMELEALRFKFAYQIKVDPSLNTEEVQVPTMVIQPLVENALKHGLALKQEQGEVTVHLSLKGGDLLCTVEDNGVGRLAAKTLAPGRTNHQSMGTLLTEERLQRLAKGRTLQPMQFTDLVDDQGTALGTRVEILLPVSVN